MPRTRRSRVIAADPGALWVIVGDPHKLPQWWPRVQRVEQVTAGQFTEVLRSDRGRTIRADHRLAELRAREHIVWIQQIEDTPFARVMSYGETSVTLSPAAGGGTTVALERRQQMRGMARFGGGLMIRRANTRVLDEALDRLADAVTS